MLRVVPLPVPLSLRTWRHILLALLTALVLVQTLGVLHRVAHAHNAHPEVVSDVNKAAALKPGMFTSLQRLWGGHSNAVDCQLFDQSCPDALHTHVLLVMPVMPAISWLAATLHERFALFERFYAARGPPAVLL
jgi:hypothetical protein